MPRPDTRLIFDVRPSCMRMDTESTDYHRDLYPDLRFVWDELDELRALRDGRDEELIDMEHDRDRVLDALSDIRDALQEIVDHEDIPDDLTRCIDGLIEDIGRALK